MKLTPTLLADFYKISHRAQYPEGTEKVYSTWTPRGSRMEGVDKVIFFGLQAFMKKYLIELFNDNFFSRPKNEVIAEYSRVIKGALGDENPYTQHISKLHDLGYLPLLIKALPEGTRVPLRVPMLTIENTHKDFFWLTNYIETLASTQMWLPCTSATIADQYRQMLDKFADETGGAKDFVDFQAHDFSMRGMSSVESGMASSAAHLLSFLGTDTITSIAFAEAFYNADVTKEMIGTSIPATEHSVMCAYGQNEFESYKRIITEIYPTGFVSIVSDTWDLWKVLSDVIAPLKEQILARDGRVVIRPDSGDPVLITTGDPNGKTEMERKGVIECLWDIFGGTINEKGFKELDTHIGCIYGDAITIARCKQICENLKAKGFASTNMVYGVGSYTYQYNTRDTFGFALKSTYVVINGDEKQIFKDPKTDDGLKKSQKGLVAVLESDGELVYIDEMNAKDLAEVEGDLLRPVFENGKLLIDQNFADIRARVRGTN